MACSQSPIEEKRSRDIGQGFSTLLETNDEWFGCFVASAPWHPHWRSCISALLERIGVDGVSTRRIKLTALSGSNLCAVDTS
jgi:hypothetical protein